MNEEGGLREKINRAQSGSQEPLGEPEEGLQGLEAGDGSKVTENKGEEEDPEQGAVNLLLEGKLSVADIAAQTGLSVYVVGGLKSQLMKKGYITSEKSAGGSPAEPKRPLSAEEQMQQEAARTLKEELASAPGCSEQSLSWIMRRFGRDPELAHSPNQLHTLLRNTCPRMDDFIIEQVVDEVLKTVESFHLERLRAPFPNYHMRPQQGRGYVDYGNGQMHPSAGYDQPRCFTEADVHNERRLWSLERKQEDLNAFLEKTNQTLEKILEKSDKPSPSAENESVKRLGDKIERLQEDLARKDKEFDQKEREHMQNQIGELKSEIKELRGNVGEWKSDEYKAIGTAVKGLVDFGEKVLDKAPLAQAAQQISRAVMPGQQQEVPAEARKTVIELLKSEGLTVPE